MTWFVITIQNFSNCNASDRFQNLLINALQLFVCQSLFPILCFLSYPIPIVGYSSLYSFTAICIPIPVFIIFCLILQVSSLISMAWSTSLVNPKCRYSTSRARRIALSAWGLEAITLSRQCHCRHIFVSLVTLPLSASADTPVSLVILSFQYHWICAFRHLVTLSLQCPGR